MAKVNQNGLTDKQQLFADYYLANNCNAKQAYIKAYGKQKTDNVAESQASRLLRNVKVLNYVNQRQKQLQEETYVTQEYVIKGLKEVAERCLQHKPVMEYDYENKEMVQATDENGEGIYQFDSNGANKAFELLGKTLGLFKDKKEISTGEGGIVVRLVDDVVD